MLPLLVITASARRLPLHCLNPGAFLWGVLHLSDRYLPGLRAAIGKMGNSFAFRIGITATELVPAVALEHGRSRKDKAVPSEIQNEFPGFADELRHPAKRRRHGNGLPTSYNCCRWP